MHDKFRKKYIQNENALLDYLPSSAKLKEYNIFFLIYSIDKETVHRYYRQLFGVTVRSNLAFLVGRLVDHFELICDDIKSSEAATLATAM